MPGSRRPKSSQEKVKAHRERLREQGLRPIQIWVPDVRSPAYMAEAHRQSSAVAASVHERQDQAYIDSISEFPDAEPGNPGHPWPGGLPPD